jgi:hypothetical protein
MSKRIGGASIGWRLKQLLPLHYCTISRPCNMAGEPMGSSQFVTWRMWFGRCFNVRRTAI